jgi:hypothetical protein
MPNWTSPFFSFLFTLQAGVFLPMVMTEVLDLHPLLWGKVKLNLFMAKEKKSRFGGLPPPIRPTAATMDAFWNGVFRRYAEELKPLQSAIVGRMGKSRRPFAR